ncbi:MAG: helix-turn-helix domain-containing protein [Burkholderiales bacterium]|nr:helix-turn-helix domain-containing protein [Burkholderiales bacterium]
MNATQQLIRSFPGRQAGIARLLGITQSAVSQWRGVVPEEHCPAIEAKTGVLCEELRPDRDWVRDDAGKVTGYHVPVKPKESEAA